MKTLRNLVVLSGLGLSVLAAGVLAMGPAFAAPAQVNDQIPAPVPSSSNSGSQSEVLIQSYSVSGGLLYQSCTRGPGAQGSSVAVTVGCSGLTFVPTAAGGLTRWQSLANARLDSGIISTSATGSSTAYGIARTTGTSYALIGAATSSSAVTTKAMWELNTADSYVAGAVLPVIVNANYTGSGTLTGASTTLTVTAYTEVNGVETAITGITAAQQFTGTAANYTFNIPTTAALVPGQHIVIEVTMLVTTASGANTGQINALGLTM